MDEGEIRRYSNDKEIAWHVSHFRALKRLIGKGFVNRRKVAVKQIEKFAALNERNKGKYDTEGDAYDCAKEKVLVNIEPASPHHVSDGVHKDDVSLSFFTLYYKIKGD